LGLLMPHSSAQILCCHWDLGRLEGVCGEAGGGGYVRQAPRQARPRHNPSLLSSDMRLLEALARVGVQQPSCARPGPMSILLSPWPARVAAAIGANLLLSAAGLAAPAAGSGGVPALYPTQAEAEKAAKLHFNCTGAHKMGTQWMPCAQHGGAQGSSHSH
jgi:hypothetical protein